MSILLSTVNSDVIIGDLGGIEIKHPTVDLQITSFFDPDEIYNSNDIKKLLIRGKITIKRGNGESITSVEEFKPVKITDSLVQTLLSDYSIPSTTKTKFFYLEPQTIDLKVILPIASEVKDLEIMIINRGDFGLKLFSNGEDSNVIIDKGGRINAHSDGLRWNIMVF